MTCYNSRRKQSVGKASSPGLGTLGAFFVLGGFMKDPHIVLRQKEQDVARVRQQIQALLTVIPLLKDEHPPLRRCHPQTTFGVLWNGDGSFR